jgi:hypothetical protein
MYTKYHSYLTYHKLTEHSIYTFTMYIMFQRPVINYYVLRFTQPSGPSIQLQPPYSTMESTPIKKTMESTEW